MSRRLLVEEAAGIDADRLAELMAQSPEQLAAAVIALEERLAATIEASKRDVARFVEEAGIRQRAYSNQYGELSQKYMQLCARYNELVYKQTAEQVARDADDYLLAGLAQRTNTLGAVKYKRKPNSATTYNEAPRSYSKHRDQHRSRR